MYGPYARPQQSIQNVRIGASGLLVMMFGVVVAMMTASNPTNGTTYGSYASVVLGLVVFSVAVSRTNAPIWLKAMPWSAPVLLVAAPAVALFFT